MALLNAPMSFIAFCVLRFFQFVLALTVCGLYGVDLTAARKAGVHSDGRWAYAVVIGTFSAVTAIVYMIPVVMRRVPLLFVWDTILFFFWVVLFGIFGKLFINEDPEGNAGIQRMKNAVWVDLVNMLLWLVSSVLMAWNWWKMKNSRSQFTGRAEI